MKRPRLFGNRSLTFKLLIGTVSILCVYVGVIGVLAYYSARQSIAKAHDHALIVDANGLVFILEEAAGARGFESPLDFSISPDALKDEDKAIFAQASQYRTLRVWFRSKLVLNSNSDTPATAPPFPEGLSDQLIGGEPWRIYSLHAPAKRLVIELGEAITSRRLLVSSIAQALIYPFLLSLPLVGFLFWRAIHSGMSDLHKVTRQVEARTPDQMTPLETARLPRDSCPWWRRSMRCLPVSTSRFRASGRSPSLRPMSLERRSPRSSCRRRWG